MGHGPSEIAAQPAALETYHAFGDLANRPPRERAERLARLAPQMGSERF